MKTWLAAPCLALAVALAPAPAFAQTTPVVLTPAEAEALRMQLILAKPNVSTVAIASFVFPGSGQAYMGHIDRTLLLWGTYLTAFTAAKVAIPDSQVTAGQKTNDLVVVGVFMGMAAVSAIDAYFLAHARRAEYDKSLNALSEKMGPPATPTP